MKNLITQHHSRIKALPAIIFLLFLIISCNNSDNTKAKEKSNSFVIVGARVFDGEQTINETNIVVRDGIIDSIGPSLKADDLPQIDGKGFTVIPGLINAHAHTESIDQLNESLRFGVTTVLDMGTFPEYDKSLRVAAELRNDVADFRSSGIFITPEGGHGTQYGHTIPTIGNANEAASFINERIELGADYLKIVLGGVRHQNYGTPTLDSATVYALVKAGHEHGKLVVAHIESADDVKLAVDAGVDGLVHQWRDSGANPDLAQLLASNNVFVNAGDIAVIDGFLNDGPQQLLQDELISPYLTDFSRQELKKPIKTPDGASIHRVMDGLRSLIEADVLLVAGTDAFTRNPRIVHGASFHRLLELFVVAGLPPEKALQISTSNVADAFRLNDRGRIKPGFIADLVMIQGDPTRDIKDTRKISKIWRRGIEVNRMP
ncbi:MAG TPA: amidohydrolase family protein [Cyclobacteriaceae bacterium]|nr:amidohydrolase family protein [Cyclobacteriaceae bacterium]